jgi:hypothetical protein
VQHEMCFCWRALLQCGNDAAAAASEWNAEDAAALLHVCLHQLLAWSLGDSRARMLRKHVMQGLQLHS